VTNAQRLPESPPAWPGTPLDADALAAATAAARPPEGFRPLPATGGFIEANGPLWLRHEGDEVWIGFRVEERHCNPMAICHGGMLATFADMVLPISVHRKAPEIGHRFLPTISLQVDYLAPAPLGSWVQGEAQVLRATRKMVFAQGLVSADGTPAVRISGVFKIGAPFDSRRNPRP
jgi:uncharacterized protein (TIGR00369 family)